MESSKMRIDILPNQFLKENGVFDSQSAINLCGKIAGVCYDKEGFAHLENESIDKTNRRVKMTLNNGHHSVYDHITINFNMQNVPKMLAMILNNEHQYTTSEKSARYTPVIKEEGSIITADEEELYNKWIEIFKIKIKEEYGHLYNDAKIQKLAQENARYLVTVFMPTQMIYSTSLRQINYLASWMLDYNKSVGKEVLNNFDEKLNIFIRDFISELDRLGMLVPELMVNEKERKLSLFGENLEEKKDTFGDVYSTTYKGSLAQLGQAQRHRTLDYQMEFVSEKEYFIPPIISDDEILVEEWLRDMNTVKDVTPQGELVRINEIGKYYDFLLKCKERLCSAAQLEIANQTRDTLLKYKKELEEIDNPLAEDINKYSRGARCTFPDFTCQSDCNFKEGKILKRRI